MQVFCFVLTPVIFLMACVSLVLGELSPDIHLFLEGIKPIFSTCDSLTGTQETREPQLLIGFV